MVGCGWRPKSSRFSFSMLSTRLCVFMMSEMSFRKPVSVRGGLRSGRCRPGEHLPPPSWKGLNRWPTRTTSGSRPGGGSPCIAWLTNVSVCLLLSCAARCVVVMSGLARGLSVGGFCRYCRNKVPRICGYGAVSKSCSVCLVVLSRNHCGGSLYIFVQVPVVWGRLCCRCPGAVVHHSSWGS